MRLLIDTNIFLEIILGQENSSAAEDLLSNFEKYQFHLTDFSLHSIGLLLFRFNKHDLFPRFLNDILQCGIDILALNPEDMNNVVQTAKLYGLDFDDAYQYVCAEKYALTIASFDHDFDRTPKGRKKPADLIS